jgi:4'-phosphopantetheinyl transferase
MIALVYCKLSKIRNSSLTGPMSLLPGFMIADIMKYKNIADRKARLIARLMLYKKLQEGGCEHLISEYKSGKNGKPFISGWDYFNISHSEDVVIFAHGKSPLGVDIEKRSKVDYLEIANFFHREEQNLIHHSSNLNEDFYRIWVKKESFLKALGEGIGYDLDTYNCLNPYTEYNNEKWYFEPIEIVAGYTCCVCSISKSEHVVTECFTLDFKTFQGKQGYKKFE